MAVDYNTQAVSLTPDNHAAKATFLLNLGNAYCIRYEQSGDTGDIHLALSGLEQASGLSAAPPLQRFTSARLWARISSQHNLPSQLTAYRQAMILIPQVIWLGSTANQRFNQISSIENVAIEAATTAIELHNYELALEWLEEGRTIVWNQLLQLRTPLDDLATVDAPLAEKLKEISQKLELAASINLPIPGPDSNQVALEEAAQQHHRLAEQWDNLIGQARSLPTMGNFLQSKRAACLIEAARTSTIVMITVHKYGCYALIIPLAATRVECISLTNITYDKVSTARAQLSRSLRAQGRTDRTVTTQLKVGDTIEKVLKMLWTGIAKPVLEFLGYTMLPMRELPRITWCTTGPLSFLPLHAAGDYSTPGCSLSDYAVSSFTLTLSALIAPPDPPACPGGILAVGQSHTLGFRPLPGTLTELNQIGKQTGDMRFTRLEGDKATTTAVLEALDEYPWVHFACHASQNIGKPTASAFHLHDGPLDIGKITKKQLKQAKMAFLSACQTAVGGEELPDEAIHIAASMIVAGYRTVIGTMWSIDDQDAPLVAEKFYAYMLDQGAPCEGKAARALHYAVQYLKAKIGLKEFGRWAPYMHIGI
ncbi:hypothetical protein FRC08_018833 [Ceratobasidium sp. 394]|nr:hypothetical protein FRC08_018833 [Ceratobasidium sp. 394]